MTRPAAAGTDLDRQLQAGDVLAGRFVIVRFLARGGMGEVYEAADDHLQGKHCALKTVRTAIAGNPAVRLRFEREVLLAREVLHPNVCPTYDLFRVDGPRGPVVFLTMKLLRGESLDARLRRSGPLAWEAALPIIRQMAAGLDAAHRAGIIHRDFKPGNVMLESVGEETRVSVTDFGLSRAFESDSTLAEPGGISGTLGYIAPELLQGGAATPASDVFAFGVVLYELLTGQRPVNKPGRTSYLAPSGMAQGLPRTWDRMVLGCLEHDPARRFQSSGEALGAIEARGTSTRAVVERQPLSRRRVVTLSAALAAAVAAGAWWNWPRMEAILHPLPQKRFVMLMAWPPATDAQMRPLLQGVLATAGARLARLEASVKDLLIISADDVADQPPVKSPADAVTALGANLVLAASLRPSGGGFELALEVLEAASGRRLRRKTMWSSAAALSGLPERAAAMAEVLLDLPASRARLNDSDELAHLSPAGFRLFTAAEEMMSQPNDAGLDQAIETYQKALDADPHFALGYARLAMAYNRKHHKSGDPAALTLARKNAGLAMRYNPDSAKVVMSQGLVDYYSGNTEEAMKAFGRALQMDPGNPQILLYKAAAFQDLGKRIEEQQVYQEILRERPNYWPAYNELGLALWRAGNRQAAADKFAEGSAVAPRVALLLTNRGSMYLLLKRPKEAADAFRQSLDRGPSEAAYRGLGDIAFEAGDFRGALDFYGKARDLRPTYHLLWRDIGDCYAMLNDAARVQESYAKAAELLSESLRTNPRRAALWMTLAFYNAKLGRRAAAEEAIRNSEERGAPDLKSKFEKAEALALLGRREEALRLVLDCMDNGLSPVDVDLAVDLKEIRADPRYKNYVARKGAGK